MQKLLILITGILLLTACQVETPTAIDIDKPAVKLELITNLVTGDTMFYNNQIINNRITEDGCLIKITAKDNADLYKVTLVAIDQEGQKYTLKEFTDFSQDTLTAVIYDISFPTSQSTAPKFKLELTAQDRTENKSDPALYEFSIAKVHPLELFQRTVGTYTPVGGSSAVNFATKTGRLVFIHFHMVYCLSCSDEAEALQRFVYGDGSSTGTVSDTSKVYIGSFGSMDDPEMNEEYITSFKRNHGLTFDCFLDPAPALPVQKFMNLHYMPGDWMNGCIAFFPDGNYTAYDINLYPEFQDWLNYVYTRFQSAGKNLRNEVK